jgi:prolyl 4-hydroxylase
LFMADANRGNIEGYAQRRRADIVPPNAASRSQAAREIHQRVIADQLAAQDDPHALAALARRIWRGDMIGKDAGLAREVFQRASVAGHGRAGEIHTNLLASGIAGERDWPLALRRLREEAIGTPRRRKTLSIVEGMDLTPAGNPRTVPQGQKLSDSPDVTAFPGLFSAAECHYLRQSAAPGYRPALVGDASSDRPARDPIRTAEASKFEWPIEDPAIHALNRRLAAISQTSFEQGEALQVLRYRPGQKYGRHLDFVPGTDNPRVLTALVYLNEDYGGGETAFTRVGLKVKGRTGDALIFRNACADLSPDLMSEHAGLRVTSGTKFLASRWIRDRRWVP